MQTMRGNPAIVTPELFSRVAELYTDGGLIGGTNPSPLGLTWSYVAVEQAGAEVAAVSGWQGPAAFGMPDVENNLAETLAILYALEAAPDGWTGKVCGDNLNALRRADKLTGTRWGRCPDWALVRMTAARRRLGAIRFELLAGHPTDHELAKEKKNGRRASVHNVRADRLCYDRAEGAKAVLGSAPADRQLRTRAEIDAGPD